jgi:hypothetical protein
VDRVHARGARRRAADAFRGTRRAEGQGRALDVAVAGRVGFAVADAHHEAKPDAVQLTVAIADLVVAVTVTDTDEDEVSVTVACVVAVMR